LRSASRVFKFKESVFWLRMASSAAYIFAQVLEVRAAAVRSACNFSRVAAIGFQIAFGSEDCRFDVVQAGTVTGALADFVASMSEG